MSQTTDGQTTSRRPATAQDASLRPRAHTQRNVEMHAFQRGRYGRYTKEWYPVARTSSAVLVDICARDVRAGALPRE